MGSFSTATECLSGLLHGALDRLGGEQSSTETVGREQLVLLLSQAVQAVADELQQHTVTVLLC